MIDLLDFYRDEVSTMYRNPLDTLHRFFAANSWLGTVRALERATARSFISYETVGGLQIASLLIFCCRGIRIESHMSRPDGGYGGLQEDLTVHSLHS